MPIDMYPRPFSEVNVKGIPGIMGVYSLWEKGTLIYYGKSEGRSTTIESRLMDHLGGRAGSCTQKATHFQFEPNTEPAKREVQLLEEYRLQYGGLPKCNERLP